MDRLYTLLQNRIEGVVSTPDQYHAGLLSNFGNLFHATPRLVVSPLTARDVAATVTFAREHGLTVSTRGAAHSQSRVAISDGGILLSMSSMRRILSVDASAPSVDVEAGVVWRDLVRHLAPRNLAPPVLTNNLSVTVGGTLAIAGIGVSSFKYGTQGDNVRELEVVAGTGERLVCDGRESCVHRRRREEARRSLLGIARRAGPGRDHHASETGSPCHEAHDPHVLSPLSRSSRFSP